jgi:nicotinamidase-related amidase
MSISFIPGETVEVPEIPFAEKMELAAGDSAVIVVDMQNDFVHPEGNLVVPAADATIPHIQQLLQTARQAEVPVVYTQDTHFEGDREWEIWPEHCRQGSFGWQIIDQLKPEPEDIVCQKNRYDGFYGTWLEHFLSYVWQVEHVVIVGTVANICVAHTAASAGLRWFPIVIPADGISALTDFDQALTLRQASGLYGGDVVKSVADITFTQ